MEKISSFTWLYVFAGGGAGSLVRFALGQWFRSGTPFPLATLLANVLAAIVLGWIWGKELNASSVWWPFLAIGFCGGMSTFSTFSLETVQLIQQGQTFTAMLNVVISVVMSVAALWVLARVAAP
jgi:fluoride exporter